MDYNDAHYWTKFDYGTRGQLGRDDKGENMEHRITCVRHGSADILTR